MAIDVYIWLSYRLHRLDTPTAVSWASLHEQPRIADSVTMALAVYPDAKVITTEDGLILHPSRPVVPVRALIA